MKVNRRFADGPDALNIIKYFNVIIAVNMYVINIHSIELLTSSSSGLVLLEYMEADIFNFSNKGTKTEANCPKTDGYLIS